ncbi:hypothetical protein ACIRU3_27750 [Streptomyces sp. NPDC101151]|uniref:hypothetical protein n=1 Tax=Streptomyces sp. NPDC101151 TaxID=3366115 RepID=UPI00380C3368
MWPGEQPPGGAQNPQNNPYQQPGYQQPNPYQQPGYQQYPQQSPQQPYGQQPQWGPPAPVGAPQPQPPQGGGGGGGGGGRTKLIAIIAATAVVVAAGVTGYLVLGGSKDDEADNGKGKQKTSHSPTTDPTATSSPTNDDPRGSDTEKPTVAGWKVVVNPKFGTAFDVPADWEVQSPDVSYFMEDHADNDKLITSVSRPASYKSKWCTTDSNKDGKSEDNALAVAGTRGESGAKSPADAAVTRVPWYVYGGYTQPDKKSITFDKKATPYKTASGIEGAYAWARSVNSPQKGKCASDGKALSFAFKNSADDIVSFDFYGAKGVNDEVDTATIMKILSSVRLHGTPTE